MKVYLSPSQQEANIGVGAYGSESKRCQDIADRVRKLLTASGVEVKQTPRAWEPLSGTTWLAKVVAASNDFKSDVHVCIHSNASSTKTMRGTDAWHYPGSVKGKALTEAVYKRLIKVSGEGNGIHTSPVFYETDRAAAPVCYLEIGFHTNKDDVANIIAHPQSFAVAIADGICAHLGVKLNVPLPKGYIPLTDRNISLPRKYKPRPGWWNFTLRKYINDVRKQGDGDRVKTAGDPLVIPVPVKWPKDLGRKVRAWKKAHRAAQLAAADKPTARKRPPFFWRRYKK